LAQDDKRKGGWLALALTPFVVLRHRVCRPLSAVSAQAGRLFQGVTACHKDEPYLSLSHGVAFDFQPCLNRRPFESGTKASWATIVHVLFKDGGLCSSTPKFGPPYLCEIFPETVPFNSLILPIIVVFTLPPAGIVPPCDILSAWRFCY